LHSFNVDLKRNEDSNKNEAQLSIEKRETRIELLTKC